MLRKLLIIAGIGFLALGGYLILGAIFPRGGYGPPDNLVLGLGILVTVMGTVLIAISFAAKTQKTDELRLTSVPGSNGEMEIQVVRTSNGTPFVSYVFKLNSLN